VAIEAQRAVLEAGRIKHLAGTELSMPCELVLLAMGFVGPERHGIVEQFGLALDGRGNVRTDASGATSVPGVFAGGDAARGQSLVVWAIADGRRVGAGVDAYLRRTPTLARAANG
jgi:glutamate synthase (NADPH/NADH) small chain